MKNKTQMTGNPATESIGVTEMQETKKIKVISDYHFDSTPKGETEVGKFANDSEYNAITADDYFPTSVEIKSEYAQLMNVEKGDDEEEEMQDWEVTRIIKVSTSEEEKEIKEWVEGGNNSMEYIENNTQ